MNPVPGIVAPVESLNAASRRAHLAAETHLKQLTSEYHTVIARAGRHAAQGFSDMNAHGLVAADPPPGWKDVPAEDLVDVTYVKSQLVDATRATRTAAAQDAMMPLMQALGISFTLQPPMVADLVARSGRRAANMSVPGILDAVRAAIRQGFEEGLSVPQVAQLIRSKCDDLAGYQAEMLARTDLIGTANGGSIIAAKTVYPEGTLTKSWLNATDSRVINDGRIRPTHLEANAQQVGLDDHFVVGDDKLLFPGDPDGSDAEVINCRCTLIYAETQMDVLSAADWDEPNALWASEEHDVVSAAWDESKHPRHPRGERVRLAIMDATTDEELIEVVGLDATLSAAVASNGEPMAASVWQSNDWGDLTAAPDVTDLAMVAVYPTAEQQQALAVPGGQDADNLHVTLVFLGDVGQFDELAVVSAVREVAARSSPLEGKVGGIGRFASGENGVPVVAMPSVKGLSELREDIAVELETAGISSPTEHGWQPHITLVYANDADGTLEDALRDVPNVPLRFDTVSYVRGDVRTDFSLAGTGARRETAQPQQPAIVLQPNIVINMPEQPAPVPMEPIVIPAPVVTVEAPPPAEVNVTVEAPPPAEVNVTVAAAEPIVIPAPEVTVQSPNVEVVVERQPARKVEFERDAGGRIVSADITEEES